MTHGMRERLYKLLKDERGGEVLEYALIAGAIMLGCIAIIRVLGQYALIGWQYINSRM